MPLAPRMKAAEFLLIKKRSVCVVLSHGSKRALLSASKSTAAATVDGVALLLLLGAGLP